MNRFRPEGDVLVWTLTREELALLVRLVTQLDEAVDGPLDDPVVQRLFPAAVEGDDQADAELRMLLAGELLLERHEGYAALVALLRRAEQGRLGRHTVRLEQDEPAMVLGVLNDVRLALGARVGFDVVESRDDVRDEGVASALATMDLLAWFQEMLLERL